MCCALVCKGRRHDVARFIIGRDGDRVSLQRLADRLAEAGHINAKGKPYNRKSVLAMV